MATSWRLQEVAEASGAESCFYHLGAKNPRTLHHDLTPWQAWVGAVLIEPDGREATADWYCISQQHWQRPLQDFGFPPSRSYRRGGFASSVHRPSWPLGSVGAAGVAPGPVHSQEPLRVGQVTWQASYLHSKNLAFVAYGIRHLRFCLSKTMCEAEVREDMVSSTKICRLG